MKTRNRRLEVYSRNKQERAVYTRTHLGSLLILLFALLPTSLYFFYSLYSWLIYDHQVNMEKLGVSFIVSVVALLFYILITEFVED